MATDQIDAQSLQLLYVSHFGRPADPGGFNYWITSGGSQKSISEYFYSSAEFQSHITGLDIETTIHLIYRNLFDRQGDSPGLNYWSNQISKGEVNISSLSICLINAVSQLDAQITDREVAYSRAALAHNYTEAVRSDQSALTVYVPTATTPVFVSGPAFAEAADFLKGVKRDMPSDTQPKSTPVEIIKTIKSKPNAIVFKPDILPAPPTSATPKFTLTNNGAGTAWTLPSNFGDIAVTSVGTNYQFTPASGNVVTIAKGNVTEIIVSTIAFSGAASELKSIAKIVGSVTVSDTGSVAAADLNTITAAATSLVTATSVATVSGTAAALTTALITNKGNSGNKLNTSNSVNVTVSDADNTDITATGLSALGAKTTGTVTVSNAVVITGTAAEVTAALVTADTLVVAASAKVTVNDATNTALTATALSALGAKTTAAVTVSNAVVISGTAAELTAALVTADTLVVAANANVNVNDAADAALTATALSAIGAKTTGTVTVSNAVVISGNTAEVTAALVTSDTLVVAANAKITITGTISVSDANAIAAKTTGVVTATLVTGDLASFQALAETGNAYTTTVNDAADAALTATALSALGAKTTGTVTVSNAVVISGNTAEVTAALVTADSLVVAANAKVTINDAADAALTATALSALGAKTTGTVTVSNAVVISGTAAELTAALVTADTLVVAANAKVTVTGTISVGDANAIAAKTTGVVTATLTTGNLASFSSLTETGNAYAITVNDAADTALTATALSALGAKTTAAVTVSNAVMITGTAAEVTAALVTADTLVVAANAKVTVTGTISQTDLNAIKAKTNGAISATLEGQNIQGTGGADVLNGTAGNDTINGGDGADTINGGAGADVMTGGAGANVFVLRPGDGLARSSENLTNSVVDGRTITFANGIDIITDFVSGKDKLDTMLPAGHGNYIGVGHDATTNLGENWTLKIRGDYNQATKVFTVNQSTSPGDNTLGVDTLILTNTVAAPTNSVNQTGWIVLLGVTTMLTADFISTANVTVPGTITVSEANTIAATTPGVVTATLTTGNLSSFSGLNETGNAYTITVNDATDTSLTATALSTLGGKTTGTVTVSNAVVITGTAAEVTAALVTEDTHVVAAKAKVNITGNITPTNFVAIQAKTTGAITANIVPQTIQGTNDGNVISRNSLSQNYTYGFNFDLMAGNDQIQYSVRHKGTNGIVNSLDTIDGGEGIDEILIEKGSMVFANDNSLRNIEVITVLDAESVRFAEPVGVNLTGQTESFTLRGGQNWWQYESLTGGSGDDTFDNIVGADVMRGGGGNDRFNVTTTGNPNDDTRASAQAIIDGGDGIDTIYVAANAVIQYAGDANIINIEIITLGAGTNINLSNQTEGFTINGAEGAEIITAGSGSDIITGGAGADTNTGGGGSDRFIYNNIGATFVGANADTITDFTLGAAGVGDVLVLSSAAFGMSVRGYSNYRSINSEAGLFANHADNIIVDTLGNIRTVGAGGAGPGANYTQNRIAFDTTNRHWLYDSDGNWSSGSIVFAISTNNFTTAGAHGHQVVVV